MNETLYLDLTRLLQAAWRRTPSGIERVEFAYAETFGGASNTIFVAGQFGRIDMLPKPRTQRFLESLEKKWSAGGQSNHRKAIFHAVLLYTGLLLKTALSFAARAGETPAPGSVYVNLSHENLRSPRALARFKSRTGAKIICFVHDLIPITHPEYARAGQDSRHRQRIETVGAMADAVIVNSADTKHEFLRFLQPRSRLPAVHVVHLGVKAAPSPPETPEITTDPSPYFLIVATIEPRKNHLLLLHLWREFGQAGRPVPRLILVGRRGWENEMLIDMLERCAALTGLVEERSAVSDRDLATLMRHARAVLLPAFAEGFGLPVCEALAAGTPVICSDLPALRETGRDVPDYLDPLDGAGWRQAILDYAQTPSPRREAQCARLEGWSPPSWERHFQQARAIIQDLASPKPQG
jgi:glycosyltransferase involved in cell wall biosynthesis